MVNVGSASAANITMQIGTALQTVEVTESIVDVTTAAPQSVLTTKAIQDLPINGRRFHEFAQLSPSVQIDQNRGSISFSGQRGINGNAMVDGTDYNNPFFGGMRGGERSGFVFTIPQSSIAEFQVVTGGYAPEYGRSTGGILNAISKSGTNAYHGDAFYQLRHKETGLKNPFNAQILENLQQFGGGVGGPILRDRLFFFAAAEQQFSKMPRQAYFANLNNVTPTAQTQEAYNFYKSQQGPLTTTNDATAVTGRGDYSFANGSRLMLRLNFSNATADNATTTGGVPPALENRAVSNSGSENDRTYTGIAQYTSILSPNIANDLRFSGTHELRPRTANSITPSVDSSIGVYGTRNFLPTVQDDTRYQINDGISIQAGSHSLKFGGDYNYLTTFQSFGFNQFGYFVFNNTDLNVVLRTLSTGTGQNRFDNSSVQYRRQIGNLLADYHMHQIAFYAQDAWRVTPNLQITYGLRWEGQVNPAAEATNTKVVNDIKSAALPILGGKTYDPTLVKNNLNQWMPRLGFSWSPAGSSNKTVVRGDAGMFYAASPMLVYGGSVNNFRAVPGDVSLTLTGTPTVYNLFKNVGIDLNSSTLDKLPIIPLDTVYAAAASVTGTQPNPFNQAGFTGMANDYQNPRSLQMGLGVDQALTSTWSTGAQFNYINTVHLERNRDYNLPMPTIRAGDGRPIFVRANRPLPQYSSLTIRESSARSMYRALTLNTKYRARHYQLGAYYTLSDNHSDDDNERSSGGFIYDNPYNLRNEYGYSDLDVRHQFTSYGVVTLPLGIELSATARFYSGRPVDPAAGSDLNGDNSSSDRPYMSVGVPFGRNSFRNQGLNFTDFRFLKNFQITEGIRLQFSTEMFNLFNFDNVVINTASSGGNKNYGAGINADGSPAAIRSDTNGVQFLRIKLPNGSYDPNNIQVGFPFQAQFGLRLFF